MQEDGLFSLDFLAAIFGQEWKKIDPQRYVNFATLNLLGWTVTAVAVFLTQFRLQPP